MIVFWLLIILVVVAVGFGIAAIFGDKLYDGAKKFADTYSKTEERKGDEEDVREK